MTNCPQCGGALDHVIDGSTLILSCENCDWSVATTYVSPIDADETLYSISLLSDNDITVEKLKVISHIIGGNFLKAKAILNNSGAILTEIDARTAMEAKEKLDAAQLKYKITPDFPHL